MKRFMTWRRVLSVGLGVLLSVGLWVAVSLVRGREAKAEGGDRVVQESTPGAISVKTVQPRLDRNFQMTVERPADVEAYYRVGIDARVAGEVKSIRVAPGSWVEKDQPLVQIYVPDLQAEVQEKGSIVHQREREVQLARAKTEAARAAVNTAEANVEEKKTLLTMAKAQTVYREQQFERLETLWRKTAVDKNVRDEAEKNLAVARAAELAAEAARIKAESEVMDAKANVSVMDAEVERTKELIEVAKADHQKALALVEYAVVKAPFRGSVVSRKVDPGSFVQNASTGHPTSLLTLERTDIVTVVMRVPDNAASFVTLGTEAVIQLDALPGVEIRGKVTRFAPSLVTAARDRTMRIEVDLWNGVPEDYPRFVADPKNLADLKEGALPLVPVFTSKARGQTGKRLLADMYGKMTLILKTFGDTHLIPSQAIIRRGGRMYMYLVEEGKAHLVPVEVQLDDGNLVQVVRLGENGEVLGGLTGNEVVIVSNQEELSEGQPVEPAPTPDWTALKSLKDSH